jgi:uncharacterized protein YrrD
MAHAQFRLGQTVYSRDGKKLGKIDRLILDDESRRVEAIVVHKLLQSADKVIDLGLVDWTDEDRVVLKIDAADAERLPAFFKEEFVEVKPEVAQREIWEALQPGVPGAYLSTVPAAGRQPIHELTSGLFPTVVPSDAIVKTESNVPFEDDVISSGTEVVALDGKTVGYVAEVFVAPDRSVSGFVVKAGIFFKHDIVVPIEWVDDIGEKTIRLKVTADQAKEARPAPEIPRELFATA